MQVEINISPKIDAITINRPLLHKPPGPALDLGRSLWIGLEHEEQYRGLSMKIEEHPLAS